MRSAMMAGAEASMVSEWQSAQSFADRTMKAVDERYASDRLNFRLQTLALTAAVGCAGVDRSDVELRLHRAESQLSELERDCDCEKQSIAAVADGKMEAMREAAAAAIDEKLEARRRQEEDRIDAAIVEARDEILGELEAFESSPSASRGVGSSELASTRGSRSSSTGSGGIAAVGIDARGAREDLSIAASRLREQIISDVERMVNEIAAQKGLRITHDPDEAESDSTSVFHEILSSRGWNESGPVLSAVVGS